MKRANTRRITQTDIKQRRQFIRKNITRGSGLILVLALSISTLFLLNQTFSVSKWEIEVTGNAAVNLEQQIDTAMKALPDYDFWSTRPGMLGVHLLKAIPDLENIRIQRTLTGSLKLHGIARSAIGLWQKDKGMIMLVDIHGSVYRPLEKTEIVDLPVLRVNKSDIHEASALLQSIQSEQPDYFSHISELFAQNNSWKINFNQGQQWMISRNQHISNSISKISDLLAKPRWRTGHWQVDARFEKRWFLRPAKQEGVI